MRNEICTAIKEKRVIRFTYDGYERIVQPHAYGIHKLTGNEVLRAYQIGGYSSSGTIPLWRLYDVSKINYINVTDELFERAAPGYRLNDSDMSQIFCQVDF
jgi:hypothetical protein